jgi:hypothetical protein
MSDHEFAHNDHGARHWDRTCPACVISGTRDDLITTLLERSRLLGELTALRNQRQEWRSRMGLKTTDKIVIENDDLRAKLTAARKLCATQADDPALWCPGTATEAYLQAALRELHATMEEE